MTEILQDKNISIDFIKFKNFHSIVGPIYSLLLKTLRILLINTVQTLFGPCVFD